MMEQTVIMDLLMLVTSATLVTVAPNYFCRRGTYLLTPRIGPEVCPTCKKGEMYRSEDWHRHTECLNCTKIQDPAVEILVRECNITDDAEILCRNGFYRQKARNIRQTDQCVRCKKCNHPVRHCQGYEDTVCCLSANAEAFLDNNGVYICKEHPILCQPGQFYSTIHEQCFHCPPKTYMSEVNHTNTGCKQCQDVDSSSNTLLLQSCNSTHPPIFGCQPGHFRDSLKVSSSSEITCSPCRACQIVRRECDEDHDTICCDNPGVALTDSEIFCNSQVPMESPVTDTSKSPPEICDKCSYKDVSSGSFICRPCADGSYNNNSDDARKACEHCSQASNEQTTASFMIRDSHFTLLLVSLILVLLPACFALSLCITNLRNNSKNNGNFAILFASFVVLLVNFIAFIYMQNGLTALIVITIVALYVFTIILKAYVFFKKKKQKQKKDPYCTDTQSSDDSAQPSDGNDLSDGTLSSVS